MIWAWFKSLFGGSARTEDLKGPHPWPTKEDIALLPPFPALGLDGVVEIASGPRARQAMDELLRESVVGFDTESKPLFVKGQVSTGPHVVQFSTLQRAYVFLLYHPDCRAAVRTLMAADHLTKVGFGLNDDIKRIRIKLNVEPKRVIDVETLFSARGYGRGVGVKVAVAIALKNRFSKSRKASTSNWMRRQLSEKQLLYAANDAYAALKVYTALGATLHLRQPQKASR